MRRKRERSEKKREEVEAEIIAAAKYKEELQARHRGGGYADAHLEEQISRQVSLELELRKKEAELRKEAAELRKEAAELRAMELELLRLQPGERRCIPCCCWHHGGSGPPAALNCCCALPQSHLVADADAGQLCGAGCAPARATSDRAPC